MNPPHPVRARGFARRAVVAVVLLGALALLALAIALPGIVTSVVTGRVRRESAARGLLATWSELRVVLPATARFRDLRLTRIEGGDTLMVADSLEVRVPAMMLLRLRAAAPSFTIAHARVHVGGRATPDSLDEDDDRGRRPRGDDPARLARVRRSAQAFARLLRSSVRDLPSIRMNDVTLLAGRGADQLWDGVHVAWLEHRPGRAEDRLVARGTVLGDQPIPFEASFTRAADLRIRGLARFALPDPAGGPPAPLRIALDGALAMDGARRELRLVDSTHVHVGDLQLRIGGRVAEQGPHVALRVAADGLTQAGVQRSLPPALLGPLRQVAVRGSWDYRVDFDMDFAHPDSVTLGADVIPHGLSLDPAGTSLNLLGLGGPFVAHIHLPRDRVVDRLMAPANPHFRTLAEIAPELVSAVVTNEDGGFFRHRGFNTEAVKAAIAENVRSASFRRGAGTITMQLARNLYLGHARTLSRKAQEVVLAWVLEHLTGLPKERLLEIYLNIIEWGPGVHGADEAARFYFDRDARDLTLDQALFMAIVVPSPSRWRWRFDGAGNLRGSARAQMHFIGRAMVAKGWLDPAALPPADQLRVEVAGPARKVLFPEPAPEPEREPARHWLFGI